MVRKLASGKYRLYSRKKDLKTGKRRNFGTYDARVWVLPNPSGLNANYQLNDLVKLFREIT